jgi:hypothetical protein
MLRADDLSLQTLPARDEKHTHPCSDKALKFIFGAEVDEQSHGPFNL